MNANVFHFIFVPSDPLQTEADLEKMINLLCDAAEDNNKSYLLQSRTLDNRTPLVLAVCHPRCNKTMIEILMDKYDIHQYLLAFDLAAKRHIEKFDSLEPLINHFNSVAINQRNKLIQIACRHNCVKMLEWLIQKEDFSKFILKKKLNYII